MTKRLHGRIASWKDDRGYGFIAPSAGGREVFMHISSLPVQRRHPLIDQIVTYQLGMDPGGRPRAMLVSFVSDSTRQTFLTFPTIRGALVAIVFLALVVVGTLSGRLPPLVVAVYVGSSAAALLAYYIDKIAARNNTWRTSEHTLHVISLIGGWPGALIAQSLFRHKSKKLSFQVVFWTTVVINCALLGWLISPDGAHALESLLS